MTEFQTPKFDSITLSAVDLDKITLQFIKRSKIKPHKSTSFSTKVSYQLSIR